MLQKILSLTWLRLPWKQQFLQFFAIVCLFLSNSCKQPSMDNLCDPYGKANISTLLLKFISHDPSTHCGINYSKLVNSPFAGSDGSSWTARTIPTGNWASVAYGNGVFVAVADGVGSTTAATSPDGINWTQRTMPVGAWWISITFGNGLFVAVASSSSTIAATSPDGINWTERTLPNTTFWYTLTYGNGVFVALSYGTSIAASSP